MCIVRILAKAEQASVNGRLELHEFCNIHESKLHDELNLVQVE
jgi:hypothetical protein